ncbi:tape measure protein, partial [Gilliamella apis]|uniref:tape measure protein n=1 Tax=Gilliamella apis TaxID=1970738 RepID=UPI000A336D19
MSFEAGSIFYTIEAKTGALLTADKEVSDFNKRAQEGFNETDRSVNSLNGSMGKLTQVAKGVVAALVTNQVFAYANAWQDLEDRLKNTGLAGMALKDVQEQLMTTSNRNGRTIEESTELYVRLSNSMSELGYSTQGTLSYIDTLSNLFTINKTNAISAESAINALTKAQMKGKLAGIDAMSVFAAMPSVLKTLGKRLKKTEAEVRQMASDGKLSMSEFTDAMIAAQDETAALADNMRNNLGDASNHFTNRLKEALGSLENTTGATQHLVSGIKMLAENMNVLIGCAGFLSAILAGRYLTSLTAAATRAKIASAIASRNETKEEVELARAELKRIDIERQSLSISLQFAEANYLAAKSVEDRIIQANRMSAIQAKMIALDKAETATKNALSAATARANTAVKLLKGGLSLLGGPTGIAIMAAGALMTWASKANEAREAAVNLKDYIKDLTEEFKKMNKEQREAALTKLNIKLSEQVKEIKEEEGRITAILTNLDHYGENGFELYTLDELNEKLSIARGNLADMKQGANELEKQIQSLNGVNEELSSSSEQAATDVDGFAKALEKLGKNKVDDKVKSLSTQLEIVQMKTKGAKREAYIYENALSELGDAGEQYKTTILGLIDKTKKWSEVSEEVRKVLQPLFDTLGKIYDENEKLNASKKSGRGTTRTYAEEIKNLKNQLEVAKLEAKHLTVEAKALAISQQIGTKATKAQADELKRLIQEQENLQNSQAGEDFAKQEIYNKKSPFEQIDIDEQEKLDKLSKWRETGLANEQTYQDALTAI